ncbi:MAG: glycosyltransferase family 2 protein [Gammaproteobacteria bacterium]|nr:glycosyltransferase family 2 protein [Gammaproteobacteria bacterium]
MAHSISTRPALAPVPNPTITVIIPTFNRAPWLAKTLGSVFGQSVHVHQVILVDDGSTDGTAGLVETLLSDNPAWRDRLLFIRQDNQGKSVALNLGLSRSLGAWVGFNDSDDCWKPEKLQRQFEALAAHADCGACFSDSVYITDDRETDTTFQRGKLALARPMGRLEHALEITGRLSHGIMMQSLLVRSDVLKKVGEFDPIMRVAQDVDFLFRLALATPLCYVNAPLVEVDRPRGRTLGLTSEFNMQSVTRLTLHEKMFQKWLTLVREQSPQIVGLIEGRLRSARSALASSMAMEGRRAAALDVLNRGLEQRFSWRVWFKRELIRLRLDRLLTPGFQISPLRMDFPDER